ncbi:unnamed protein product, partial [Ostreobium quekettii]
MGGVGKTTLAKSIMHDERIKTRFVKNEKTGCLGLAFVTVSDEPDIMKCHKRIWDVLVGEKAEFCSVEDGKLQLRAKLQGKTYLLVLDDLWDATDMMALDVASTSGRVLITSRNDKVAQVVHARRHDVTCLDENESHKLFRKHAFGEDKPKRWQEEHIKAIVEKCGGLPLALEIMGKVVNNIRATGGREEKDMWKNAVDALATSSLFQATVVDRVFYASFNRLGSVHQSVLLDLATLPENYRASECDEAELQKCIGTCDDEGTVRKVLRELEDRGLIKQEGQDTSEVLEFQPRDGGVHYYLHDVVRDCALRAIAGITLQVRQRLASSHLKHSSCKDETLAAKRFSASEIIGADQLRTLQNLQMQELKAIVLKDAGISELPPTLLTSQLVAIDLTSSGIVKLPSQISCLQSAQLLRVDYCEKLACLPGEVGELVQLRVLSMRGCRSIHDIPASLGHLSMLTKLLMPQCGIAHSYHPDMKAWHKLTMLDLSRCTGLKCLPPKFGDLASLTALNLGGCWQLTSLPASIGQLSQLEVLILHKCDSLMELPSSMADLSNLQELDVQRCPRLVDIPDTIGGAWLELRVLRLQGNGHMAFPLFVKDLECLEVLGIPEECEIPEAFNQMLEDLEISLELEATELCEHTILYWDECTPLHWCASNGLDKMVEWHLRETQVDFRDKVGRTPLVWAAREGHAAVAEMLLNHGASVDLVDN